MAAGPRIELVSSDGGVAEVRCPLCDQPIPHEHFDEVYGRIQAREQARREAADETVNKAVERERLAATKRAEDVIAREREEAAAQLEVANEKFAALLVTARKEAKQEGELSAAEKIAAADKARESAQKELEATKASHAAELDGRLQEQRDALELDHQKALSAEKAKAFEERLKVEEKVEQLQRQLQKRRADELGEGAEIDLFETLKGEFPQDRITRVKKGEAGADILHKVIERGGECGLIIYDSKNRGAWRNDYVSKLREDQIAAKADIAILTSRVFPAGVRQLHFQDGVIVTSPARALALVTILRRHVVQIHGLRLSNKARDDKMAQLYEFVSSDEFAVLLEQIETLTDDLLELDVKEQAAHSRVWNRRGGLVRSIQRAHGDLTMALDRLMGKDESTGRIVL